MDAPKTALLGLIFLCGVAVLLLLAIDEQKKERAEKERNRACAGKKGQAIFEKEPHVISVDKGEASKSMNEDDEMAEFSQRLQQSRLGVPPPGEKRVEAVAPRAFGNAKR